MHAVAVSADGQIAIGSDDLDRWNGGCRVCEFLQSRQHAIELKIHAPQVEPRQQIGEVVHSAVAGERCR